MTAVAPNPYLAGNYGPVPDEITATDLPVHGAIPAALSGRYLRTGPNPHGAPQEPFHWFLGDGMIHGIELRDGRAQWYRNRWVRTDPMAATLGEAARPGPAQPMYDSSNTNVVGFGDKILSLTEGAYPYLMTRDLETIGRFDTGELPHGLTAHPKIDPRTDELVGFSYWFSEPFLYFHTIDLDGRVTRSQPIDLPRSVSMHDFAITEHHVLFFDQPYVFDLDMAIKGGFPFRWAPEFGARLGVLARGSADAQVQWFETETCYCFHPMNAYETGDGKIVVDVPKMDGVGSGSAPAPTTMSFERWTVDLAGGAVRQDVVDPVGQEFCRINESLLGTKHRYGYAIEMGAGMPYSSTTLFKHDFDAATRTDHDFGAGRHPGEFVFVADPDRAGAEDGGWCMGLVHDETVDRTSLVILDAQDFAGEPVATVQLPRRVPYGFHGNWVAD